MSTFDRPREIIDFCLKPFAADKRSDAYTEAYKRLEHVIKTFQMAAGPGRQPVAVDFSQMRTLTINEAAHGLDEDAA